MDRKRGNSGRPSRSQEFWRIGNFTEQLITVCFRKH